jgi:hypothetical protein
MYVRERLSLGPRWCGDTRALARRLEERPALREALVRGRVGWSMAELLARHSTGDDEGELIAAVEGLTLREVREALRERGVEDVEEEGSFATLDMSLTKPELAAFEATRMGVEHVNGGPGELKQLRLRFGALTEADEARVREGSIEELDRWAERVLSAQSLAEIWG